MFLYILNCARQAATGYLGLLGSGLGDSWFKDISYWLRIGIYIKADPDHDLGAYYYQDLLTVRVIDDYVLGTGEPQDLLGPDRTACDRGDKCAEFLDRDIVMPKNSAVARDDDHPVDPLGVEDGIGQQIKRGFGVDRFRS